MRFRATVGVAAAIATLIATTFLFGLIPADAHVPGITFQPHHIKTPPQIKAAPVDNVRDFGAMGDGVTDDTNAIQNAANNAAANGKAVYFPPGIYLHASSITFNSVPVIGVGTGSILVANTVAGSAVILTGNNVSIQNMVVSTQSLVAVPPPPPLPQPSNLLVQNANSFTIANNTIVQGSGFCGVLVQLGAVGSINANVFDGAGGTQDTGVSIKYGSNLTVSNNLMQNEAFGVAVGSIVASPSLYPNIPTCSFIALVSNTIGNIVWPTSNIGIALSNTKVMDVAQNTIQMANGVVSIGHANIPVALNACDEFQVTGNSTYGGGIGMEIDYSGPTGNRVTQNAIRNCGGSGINILNQAVSPSLTSNVSASSNAFGECGIYAPQPVISIFGNSADSSGATTFVQNNSYQGHLNNLTFLVLCNFTAPHISPTNVTGNTQSQTMLTNSI